jgi:hypothetical protein
VSASAAMSVVLARRREPSESDREQGIDNR